jgi:hypothetical protein
VRPILSPDFREPPHPPSAFRLANAGAYEHVPPLRVAEVCLGASMEQRLLRAVACVSGLSQQRPAIMRATVRALPQLSWWPLTFRQALTAIAIVLSLLGCRAAQEPVVVPPELIGVWKTADPRYEDRYFELTIDTITLAMGEDTKESYPIQKLEKSQEMRTALYSLTYRNLVEGVTDTLLFSYDQRGGGVIRFKDQRNLEWTKGSKS